jgi:N-acetylmuramoyl-L-alanine amidase
VVLNYEGGQEPCSFTTIPRSFLWTGPRRSSCARARAAYKLLANMVGTTGGESRGVPRPPLCAARVIHAAVLIELGFISNKEKKRSC